MRRWGEVVKDVTPIRYLVPHHRAANAPGEGPLCVGDDTLTVEATARFARDPKGANIRVSPDAEERIARSVALKHAMIATRQPIYGVTTGFGDSVIRQISPQKARRPAAEPRRLSPERDRPRRRARGRPGDDAGQGELPGARLLRGPPADHPADPRSASTTTSCPSSRSGDRSAPAATSSRCATSRTRSSARGRCWPAARCARPARRCASAGWSRSSWKPRKRSRLINGTSFMSGFGAIAAFDAAELVLAAERLHRALRRGAAGQPRSLSTQPSTPTSRTRARPGARAQSAPCSPAPRSRGHTSRSTARTRPSATRAPRARERHPGPLLDPLRAARHRRPARHAGLGRAAGSTIEINSTNDNPLFDPDSGPSTAAGTSTAGTSGRRWTRSRLAVASVGDLLDRQLALRRRRGVQQRPDRRT